MKLVLLFYAIMAPGVGLLAVHNKVGCILNLFIVLATMELMGAVLLMGRKPSGLVVNT